MNTTLSTGLLLFFMGSVLVSMVLLLKQDKLQPKFSFSDFEKKVFLLHL